MATQPKRPTKSVEELIEEREARSVAFATEQDALNEQIVSALREQQRTLEQEERARKERYNQAQRAAEIATRAREDMRRAEEERYLAETRRLSHLNGLDETKYTREVEPQEEPVPDQGPEPTPEAAPTSTTYVTEVPTTVTHNVILVDPDQPEEATETRKGRKWSLGAWLAAIVIFVVTTLVMQLVYPAFFPDGQSFARFVLAFLAIPLTTFFVVGTLVAKKRQRDY